MNINSIQQSHFTNFSTQTAIFCIIVFSGKYTSLNTIYLVNWPQLHILRLCKVLLVHSLKVKQANLCWSFVSKQFKTKKSVNKELQRLLFITVDSDEAIMVAKYSNFQDFLLLFSKSTAYNVVSFLTLICFQTHKCSVSFLVF